MKFETGTISNIRSISQRALAAYWGQLANKGNLPSFEQFEPSSRMHDPKQLAVWKVERGTDGYGFRSLYRGRFIDEAFNDIWYGKTLIEVTPPSLLPMIVDASAHCASTGCAVYTVLRTQDAAGFSVDLERLLLPFGTNGRVRQIVASLQLVSLKGEVNRSRIVENFQTLSELILAIRLAPERALTASRG